MKDKIKSLYVRSLAGSVLGLSAAASSAHGGHAVARGIQPQQHIHLFDQVVVSPTWLTLVGLVAVALTALVVRRRVRAKAD